MQEDSSTENSHVESNILADVGSDGLDTEQADRDNKAPEKQPGLKKKSNEDDNVHFQSSTQAEQGYVDKTIMTEQPDDKGASDK